MAPSRAPSRPEAPSTFPPGSTCTLNFNSIPVASIVLDGKPVGETPRTGYATSAGSHVVVFEHPTIGPLSTSVFCKPGETKVVAVRLGRSRAAPLDDDLEKNPYR